MKVAELPDLVYDGRLDSILEELSNAVWERRRMLRDRDARRKKRDLVPGTPVVIVGGIKPKYLVGSTGTVLTTMEAFEQGYRSGRDRSLPVKLDFPNRRYRGVIGIPANCLERAS